MTKKSTRSIYNLSARRDKVKTTVYGDILFVINFSMDLISLYISGKLLHLQAKRHLLCIASLLGGIYGVFALFIKSNTVVLLLNIAVYLLMCFIAYPKSKKRYIKLCIIFYGVSLLCGGAVTSSYSFLDKLFYNVNINTDFSSEKKIPVWVFVLVVSACLLLSYITGRIFLKSTSVKHADITAVLGQRSCKIRVLADSGNLLVEPLSGAPVVVVPPHVIEQLIGCKFEDILLQKDVLAKLRYIPISTASGNGVLTGILPDNVSVKTSSGQINVRAVIAAGEKTDFSGFEGVAPLNICE